MNSKTKTKGTYRDKVKNTIVKIIKKINWRRIL